MLRSFSLILAPLPPPTILTISSTTPTSITLTWEQSEASAGAVDSYLLYYEYTVNQCSGDEGDFPPVIATIADGSLREYTIENSADTPVEEDSDYSTITLRAVNVVDTSEPSNSVMATTGIASEYCYAMDLEILPCMLCIQLLGHLRLCLPVLSASPTLPSSGTQCYVRIEIVLSTITLFFTILHLMQVLFVPVI